MRAFLALPLPEHVRREVEEVPRVLGLSDGDWRIVASEGWHVTVRFFGEVDPLRLERLHLDVDEAAGSSEPFGLAVRGAGAFPSARRPRTIWLGVDELRPGGVLAALARRLEAVATALGFAPETRPFHPHVTLARARGPHARSPALTAVGPLGEFDASDLVLYRSITGPAGATYHEERRYALGGRVRR
jgi:2'-5' RNA ligase